MQQLRIKPTTFRRAWELAFSGRYKSLYIVDDNGNRWNLVALIERNRDFGDALVPANMGWPIEIEWAEPCEG